MKKILIIEDNKEVRENMDEILALSGYKTFTAANGKEGVETALAQIPDLVICDIMMPILDGYGVLHLLQKQEATATIPFIFLTAKAEKADLRKGMEMGADDYITKPFDGIELLKAVEMRLKKHAAMQLKSARPTSINEQEKTAEILTGIDREVYQHKKKEQLYMEGRRPKAVYYIVTGKVKVFKTNEVGKEFVTNVYTEGNFIGYLPILEDGLYNDNATILEDADIMQIPREDFLQLVTGDKNVAAQFIKLLTKDVLLKEETLLNLAYNSLRKKVAFGLVKLAALYNANADGNITITMQRETLAQVIAVATESLIRTLADFKSEGLIELLPGKVTILNYQKLSQLPY